ncbi:DUF2484 family protein [Rhodobacteraceae bacterium CCMM004]|nr:DUF2484 family protein [Rhodobacteraceae bacterium CCMM004]
MSLPLILALVWMLAANVAALLPSRRSHWPAAWGLIATGVPLVIWVAVSAGPWWALACLVAGASVLRWPVYFLGRRIGRLAGFGRDG